MRVFMFNVASSLLLTYGLRSRVHVTVRLTVHLVHSLSVYLWCGVFVGLGICCTVCCVFVVL
jgi:hypothetical protein